MATEYFFQNVVFTRFAWPFLLIFFVIFAILEKTKVLGDGKKQLNALTAFVIGLIVVSVSYPTEVINNLILFLTVAMISVFVILLLWGFVSADAKEGFKLEGWMKWLLWIVVGISFIIAMLWATGVGTDFTDLFLKQDWSGEFWTNATFIIVIAVALALILKSGSSKS